MEEIKKRLRGLLTEDKKDRSRLISLLQEVQQEFGYLPQEAMLEIAQFLGLPPSNVYGVATFFNQFRLTPVGKHPIRVCLGTACHLAGGKLVLEAVERELGIKVGTVTEDGRFGLERVACIGCCALAPVMTINDNVYPKLTPVKVEEVLTLLKSISDEK